MGDGPTHPDDTATRADGDLQTASTIATPPCLPADGSPRFGEGDVLAGRYGVRRFLARGGMGEVYEAFDLDLGIPVALKTIRPELAAKPGSLERFKREVLLARAVSHPGVCRIFDLHRHRGEDGEVAFLTMELLHGETLRRRIAARGPLPAEEVLPLFRQMVEALEAAHRSGVVHRDFKSANVIIAATPEGDRVVVTDFGLARTHELRGRLPTGMDEAAMCGTPAYMAPEQVRGERAGPAADLYALGVVLFEMLTGRLPFRADSSLETAWLRLTEDPPRPSTLAPVAQGMEDVVLRLLAREPSRRFARAADALRALAGEAQDAGEVRNNLPAEADAFVGRERELDELDRAFAQGARLVSLLGPGGAGKTRLARRYGSFRLGRWPDGVWFCDLSKARDLEGVHTAVAQALDVPIGSGDAGVRLGHAIAGRGRCLLILDNLEQVAEPAAAWVPCWLERARRAAFLVTSRTRLGLEQETALAVEPLPVEDGLQLLAARARLARPGFALSDANRPVLAEVVKLLEGFPLALELAAARLRLLSPVDLHERLRDRFRVLAAARPSAARQSGLKASIDWSWELLLPWEKGGFAQAAVFEGGFTVAAAEAVLDLGAWPEAPSVLDLVQALVDRSLLRAWAPERDEEPRFGMYESLHEYAAERLRAEALACDGATGRAARRAAEERHGRWFARLRSEAESTARRPHGRVQPRRALAREMANLNAACRRAVERGDAATAVATFVARAAVLQLTGPVAAALELAGEVEALPGLSPAERAAVALVRGHAERVLGRPGSSRACYERALSGAQAGCCRHEEGQALAALGALEREAGRPEEGRRSIEAALAIARETGDRGEEANVLTDLGVIDFDQGRIDEALARFQAGLQVHREVGNRHAEARMLGNIGALMAMIGSYAEVERSYREALAIHRELGDRRGEGNALGGLGILHRETGRLEEAKAFQTAGLAIHREIGDRRQEGMALLNLGILAADGGALEQARAYHDDALAIFQETGDRRFESVVLVNQADVARGRGDLESARSACLQALAIARDLGHRRLEGATLAKLAALDAIAGKLAEARERADASERLLREVKDRPELAKLLCTRGEVELLEGRRDRALSTLAEATLLAAELATGGPDSELGRGIGRLRALLETGAGDAASRPCT